MKCLVIDDEPIAIEILEDYIKKIPFLESAGSFRSALKALEYLQNHSVDLIFLDIKMRDLSGIQFLKSLTNQPLVIFTTAYSEFAVESYDYQVVDYLLKPIEFERFLKASNKALKQHRLLSTRKSALPPAEIETRPKNAEVLLIKSGTDYHPIKFDDILYIEGAGNYVVFVTHSKSVMALMNLKSVTRQLPADRFFRIHKSYIVNFRHIDTIETDQLKIGNTTLPIGETYKKAFLEKLKDFGEF
ncbi:MAG: response regulator transcription factor [Candidatus Aminicenantes bacterium]|nr:response regulator transcription factor [Candidatus Aminicenantes bacterium]